MTVKRRYESPARRAAAQDTRDRICAVAEELFVRDGYARTSIRAVAREAGVSEATMYLAFDAKGDLLDAAILRAIAESGSEPVSAIAAAPTHEVLPRFAAANAALMRRAARLIALGESAALMDAELRPFRERAHGRIRAAFRVVADRLEAEGMLRAGADEAADTLYAIASDATYLRMTGVAGLAPERYAAWLDDTLSATLLGDSRSTSRISTAVEPK